MTAATKVCVIGSGWRFTSGISYYTCRLSGALAERAEVTTILMRRLLPRVLYPGRDRVGRPLSRLAYDPRVTVYDGVDWYWGAGIVRAVRMIRRTRPDVVVLEWWTAAVLHSYFVLVLAARSVGARVVVEFHEVQDTGEARLPLVGGYARHGLGAVLARADGFLVHSAFDRDALRGAYDLSGRPVRVVAHGPYDHHRAAHRPSTESGVCRVLYFGTIRPYKGLEFLVRAFGALDPAEAARLRLTVVGETWEGWTLPLELIAASPHRDRITLVNRYVADEEVTGFFAEADAVVLPYLRSSASGPLHIAMSNGLPVVVTSVGGLTEAAAGYRGALLVPPGDEAALTEALRRLPERVGRRYADPHSWERNAAAVLSFAPSAAGSGSGDDAADDDAPADHDASAGALP